jgi:His-Xaa-Ser system protein HxsD
MAAEITVDFDAATQSLSALNAAAYRLAGTATCQIDKDGTRYVCRLTPNGQLKSESLRSRYLELVIDENVREELRTKTEPIRNLILSLAFGSLAAQSKSQEPQDMP